MPTLEVRAHGLHPLKAWRKFWEYLGTQDIESSESVLKRECSKEQLEVLKAGSEAVKFEPTVTNNVAGAGSKKNINKENNEQQKVQTTRGDKSDDFIR